MIYSFNLLFIEGFLLSVTVFRKEQAAEKSVTGDFMSSLGIVSSVALTGY